jgi:hypothetical protein
MKEIFLNLIMMVMENYMRKYLIIILQNYYMKEILKMVNLMDLENYIKI